MPSFKSVAYEILKKAKKPLHYKEITEIALKENQLKTSGKTPHDTMHAQLMRDISSKGRNSRFVKVSPSNFALNKKIKKAKEHIKDREAKSTKGKLIKGMSGRLPSEILESPLFNQRLKEIMRHNAGIYALYRNEKLYYVGLTKNLFGRLRRHLEDRHTGKWDSFIIFKIQKVDYLKDIETLIHHIADAPGNRVKGKVPKDANINRLLHEVLREQERSIGAIKKVFK